MINEEKGEFYLLFTISKWNEIPGLKKKLLDSLEVSMKNCVKLSKEMGVSFEEPDSNLVLIKLEHSMRVEAKKLKDLKDERMKEVLKLRKQDEDLCQRLGVRTT